MRFSHTPYVEPAAGYRTSWKKKFAWLPVTIFRFTVGLDGSTTIDYSTRHTVWLESYYEQKEAYYGKVVTKFGYVLHNRLKWKTRRVLHDQFSILDELR